MVGSTYISTMASFEEEVQELCTKHGKDPQSFLKKEGAKAESIDISEGIKKVVVEHVIQEKQSSPKAAFASVYRRKLRLFSGTKPTPSGEVNFATWKIPAKLLAYDDDMDERDKKRSIMDSLLIPALNMVKNVPRAATAGDIYEMLVKVYGPTRSSDDMMYDFFEIYQMEDQSASQYLENLFMEITNIIDESAGHSRSLITEEREQLLNQFLRGCWDEDLIDKLKLEAMKESPPSFEILFEMIKKEESRREQKQRRKDLTMKHKKRVQQHGASIANGPSEDIITEQHQFRTHMEKKYDDVNGRITALEEGQKTMLDKLNDL